MTRTSSPTRRGSPAPRDRLAPAGAPRRVQRPVPARLELADPGEQGHGDAADPLEPADLVLVFVVDAPGLVAGHADSRLAQPERGPQPVLRGPEQLGVAEALVQPAEEDRV